MKYITMHVNAAIALRGFAQLEDVEILVEQIRHDLHEIDSIANVAVELLAVGSNFGGPDETMYDDALLVTAEQVRRQLLNDFWLHQRRESLYASLRLAHVMASMDLDRLGKAIDKVNYRDPEEVAASKT